MTECLIINTPGYESYSEDAHQDELVFEGDMITIHVTYVKTTEEGSIPRHTKDGLPIPTKVEFVDASDPDCILETHSVAIPPCGILVFDVALEAIGKSFRIRAESTAESTDGTKLSCKKSLRTYRVVRAKLHVENIEGIVSIWEKDGNISYFYTKHPRNCITVDVSIRDKNGNVLDNNSLQGISEANMMSCSTECEDIDITTLKSGQQVSPIDGRWCRMQFRMELRSKKQVPLPAVVVRIKSQYADVGYTVLQPIKVKRRKNPSPLS